MTARADLAERRGEAAAALFERRTAPVLDLADQARDLAGAAHAMAVRFHQGGMLLTFGTGGASTDAQHIAVEFMHPVIVGKRALPAICLSSDEATMTGIAATEGMAAVFAHQIRCLAEPSDIALGVSATGSCPAVLGGLVAARELGLATVALVGGHDGVIASSRAVDRLISVASIDPRVIKEMHVSSYHLLWELVHVFLEQPSLLGPGMIA